MLIMGVSASFWGRVVIDDAGYETACLTWTGAKITAGYGNLRIKGVNHLAHRLVYAARYGEIPKRIDGDRAVIDHLCRNRACVNIDHLELVTNRINILRGDTIQAANAARTHCVNGHAFTPENTYRAGKYGRGCRTCKRERQRKGEPPKPRGRKTNCKRGHEFTEENTYIKPDGRRACRACMRAQRTERTEREREQRGPAPDRKKTVCKHGHEFTPENTYYYPNGKRRCRSCMREQSRKDKQKRKREQ